MLDFAERTGSGIIIVVWSFLLSMPTIDTMMSPPLPANSLASHKLSLSLSLLNQMKMELLQRKHNQ
jgi:hypothetical protein